MIQQSENALVLREKARGKDVWEHFKTPNFVPFLTSVEDWQDWVLFLLWHSHDSRSEQQNFNYQERIQLPFELGDGSGRGSDASVFHATLQSIKKYMMPEKKKLFEQAVNNVLKTYWDEENFLDVLFNEARYYHGEWFHFSSENLLFLLEKNISEDLFSETLSHLVYLKGANALPKSKITELLCDLRYKYCRDDERLSHVAFAFVDVGRYEDALETMTYIQEVCESFGSRLESYLTLGNKVREFFSWITNSARQEDLEKKFFSRMISAIQKEFSDTIEYETQCQLKMKNV